MRSLGFFTAALLSTAAFGQNGSIAGTILATDGGAISNATVTAKNAAGTGVSAKSNSKGGYSIASVAPGTYEVTVELPPLFMTYTKKDVRVEAGKAARLDVELEDVNLNTLGDGASGFAYLSADKPAPKGPAPRTRDGKPDLSGVWLPQLSKGVGAAPALLPWADELVKKRQDHFEDFPNTRCQPMGIGFAGFFAPYEIVQSPNRMVIMEENGDPARIVYLDGRAHPKDPNPSWLGHSVGRWEGDTLVIDTVGFNDRAWLGLEAYPQTEKLHVIERMRRTDLGHLEIVTTFDDASTFKQPWTTKRVSSLGPKDMELLEYVCTENNKDLPHLSLK